MPIKGFVASLFDLSFTSLITTRLVKFVYLLFIVLDALTALVFVIAGFATSPAAGLLVLLIGAPLLSLFYLVFVRVFLEGVIALFRIMENTQALRAEGLRVSAAEAVHVSSSRPSSSPADPFAPMQAD